MVQCQVKIVELLSAILIYERGALLAHSDFTVIISRVALFCPTKCVEISN